MQNLRDIAEDSRYSVVKTSAKLTLFPVKLELPEDIKEAVPRTVSKSIEGIRVMRFYSTPTAQDTIEFKGFVFKVLRLHHEDLKVKGSHERSKMPIVITEFVGFEGQPII